MDKKLGREHARVIFSDGCWTVAAEGKKVLLHCPPQGSTTQLASVDLAAGAHVYLGKKKLPERLLEVVKME